MLHCILTLKGTLIFSLKGGSYARSTPCYSDFTINHGGRNDVTTHVKGKHHKEMATASSSSRSITSMFNPKVSESAIKAEALWAMFVAKHNIPFLASDHANILFPKMFPDSELAKQFSSGRTKTTAIVTQALAPHFLNKVTSELRTIFHTDALFLSECLTPVWEIAVLGFWICQLSTLAQQLTCPQVIIREQRV